MISVFFMPAFLRQMNRLEDDLVIEVREKIELFKDIRNHKSLKVHKLHGSLSGWLSFSVNYKTRIVFRYDSKNVAVLLAIGDHDVYK